MPAIRVGIGAGVGESVCVVVASGVGEDEASPVTDIVGDSVSVVDTLGVTVGVFVCEGVTVGVAVDVDKGAIVLNTPGGIINFIEVGVGVTVLIIICGFIVINGTYESCVFIYNRGSPRSFLMKCIYLVKKNQIAGENCMLFQ